MEIFFRRINLFLILLFSFSCNFQNNQVNNWYVSMMEKSVNFKKYIVRDFEGVKVAPDIKLMTTQYYNNTKKDYETMLFLGSAPLDDSSFMFYMFDENLNLLNRKKSSYSFYDGVNEWTCSLLDKKENSFIFYNNSNIMFSENSVTSIFDNKIEEFEDFYKNNNYVSSLDSILYPNEFYTNPSNFNGIGSSFFINSSKSDIYSYKLFPSSTFDDLSDDNNFFKTFFTCIKYIQAEDTKKYEKRYKLSTFTIVNISISDKYKIFDDKNDFEPYTQALSLSDNDFRVNNAFMFNTNYNDDSSAILLVSSSVVKKVNFPADLSKSKTMINRFYEDNIITIFKIPYDILSKFSENTSPVPIDTLSKMPDVKKVNFMIFDEKFSSNKELSLKSSNLLFGNNVILTKIAPFKWTKNGLIILIETCDKSFIYKSFYGLLKISEDFTTCELDKNFVVFNEVSYTNNNLDKHILLSYPSEFKANYFSGMKLDRLKGQTSSTKYDFNYNYYVDFNEEDQSTITNNEPENTNVWAKNLGSFSGSISLDAYFSIDAKYFYHYNVKSMRLVKGVTGW